MDPTAAEATVRAPLLHDLSIGNLLSLSLLYRNAKNTELCVIQRLETAISVAVAPHRLSLTVVALGVDESHVANGVRYRLLFDLTLITARVPQSVVVVRNDRTLAQLVDWLNSGSGCGAYSRVASADDGPNGLV
jgi:hypothetical protein